jgi:hypothetical protein
MGMVRSQATRPREVMRLLGLKRRLLQAELLLLVGARFRHSTS